MFPTELDFPDFQGVTPLRRLQEGAHSRYLTSDHCNMALTVILKMLATGRAMTFTKGFDGTSAWDVFESRERGKKLEGCEDLLNRVKQAYLSHPKE